MKDVEERNMSMWVRWEEIQGTRKEGMKVAGGGKMNDKVSE